MSEHNIEDPTSFDMNQKPEGIQRIRRTPFVVFIVIFVGIVVFQIFNISRKNEERFKQKKKEQEQVSVHSPGQSTGQKWFEKDIYDNLRAAINKEGTSTMPADPKTMSVQTSADGEQSLPGKGSVEKVSKTKLELSRLQEAQKIEMRKAYYDALKSPGQVARFKNRTYSPVLEADSQKGNDGPQLTGPVNNPFLSALPSSLSGDDLNRQKDKTNFLKSGVLPGDYLPHLKQDALSPLEVKAGSFLPAALITGINSDLPGNVIAQVRENVYDTVTGEHLLIPQGAKLIGEYDSHITFGQNRALVIWLRLIFPDGSSLNLEKMQGVDIAGYAGFKDRINNHYLRIYGNALLLSLVGAGYEVLNPGINQRGDTANTADTVASNIGQQLAQTASELTRKNIDIQPTITIRPGYKFNVFILKDMILEEVTKNEF
jgi:type IV secretion system protein VirB10